jgi:hypothetical protein
MKSDSISMSAKIKELFDLHKSGVLSDDEYRAQLKSIEVWLISRMNMRPFKEAKTEKGSMKVSKKDIASSSMKFNKDEYDLIKSDIITQDDNQPIKEKVEKILWILLN